MVSVFKNKTIGFYISMISGISVIVAFISFITWAPHHDAMSPIIISAFILGLVLNTVLAFYDNEFIIIAVTALYSIAFVQLVSDSVGSFVDSFQGIVMFGDSTQVGRIIFICLFIFIGILTSLIASFMKRRKI